jgi:hypothetical protein
MHPIHPDDTLPPSADDTLPPELASTLPAPPMLPDPPNEGGFTIGYDLPPPRFGIEPLPDFDGFASEELDED